MTGSAAGRLCCRQPLHLEMKLLEEWLDQCMRKGSLHPGKSENPHVQGLLCPAEAVSGAAWYTALPALHSPDVPAAAASRPGPLLGAALHCIPLGTDAINPVGQGAIRQPAGAG